MNQDLQFYKLVEDEKLGEVLAVDEKAVSNKLKTVLLKILSNPKSSEETKRLAREAYTYETTH